MTIKYCDYTLGDDTTGDGSASNPYKTITQASTGLTGGDEVRCAKSPAHTSLAGTLAWVDGSASITTTSDLTGVLAAGDFVGKDATGETWWRVESISASAITLEAVYSGSTETIASKKLGITDVGHAATYTTQIQAVSSSGTSVEAYLKISGGWALATEIQDGETWFWQSGSRAGYHLYVYNRNSIHLAKLGFMNAAYGIYGYGVDGSLFEEITVNGNDSYGMNITSACSLNMLSCWMCGNYSNQLYHFRAVGGEIDSCTFASSPDDNNVAIDSSAGVSFINCNSKRSYGRGFYVSQCGTLSFINCTVLNNAAGYYIQGSENVRIIDDPAGNQGITALADGLYETEPIVCVQHQAVAGVNKCYFAAGETIANTAEARSGTCVQFDPSSAIYYIQQVFRCKADNGVARTLKIWMKDDVSFNGDVQAALYFLGQKITGWTAWTMTTSYVEQTIYAAAVDVTEDGILELRVKVRGTAGNVYADDFSYQ